jgi:hypothetical protein
MALSSNFVTKEPTRAEIDVLNAPTVLEFGTAHECRPLSIVDRLQPAFPDCGGGLGRGEESDH